MNQALAVWQGLLGRGFCASQIGRWGAPLERGGARREPQLGRLGPPAPSALHRALSWAVSVSLSLSLICLPFSILALAIPPFSGFLLLSGLHRIYHPPDVAVLGLCKVPASA